MRSFKTPLVDLIQIATGLALVIGLVLVFIELIQAKALTLAELTSQGYSEIMADARAVMGENPAPVIAKACLEPEALQPDEMLVLQAYYVSKVTQVTRLRVLELVADFGVPWQEVARQQIRDVVDTSPGQRWFEQQIKGADDTLYAIGKAIQETGVDCTQEFAPIATFAD